MCASAGCVILWLVLSAVFKSGEVFGDNAFADMFVSAALKSIRGIYIVFAVAFAVGIVLTVTGAIGVSAASRRRQEIRHI